MKITKVEERLENTGHKVDNLSNEMKEVRKENREEIRELSTKVDNQIRELNTKVDTITKEVSFMRGALEALLKRDGDIRLTGGDGVVRDAPRKK